MLLIEETIKQFGYDPRSLSHGSHKLIVRRCDVCSNEKTVMWQNYRKIKTGVDLCLPCNRSKMAQYNNQIRWAWDGINEHPQVDHEETMKRFGHDSRRMRPKSNLRIVYKCIKCNELRETIMLNLTVSSGICGPCKRSETILAHINKMKAQGLTSKGTELGKYWEIDVIARRLRHSLRSAFRRSNRRTFRHLPYTPQEAYQHITNKLKERSYLCPLCQKPINDKYHIDHKIPIASAKTPDDVLGLFALDNLDVLCPTCNIRKGMKRVEY